jgi:hypothetical protein
MEVKSREAGIVEVDKGDVDLLITCQSTVRAGLWREGRLGYKDDEGQIEIEI